MRKIHWLIIIIILLFPVSGILFYPHLPEQMGTHWSGGDVPDDYMGKFAGTVVVAIVLMIVIAVLLAVNIWVSKLSKSKKIAQLMDFITLPPCIFLLMSYIVVLAWNAGADFSVTKFMSVGVLVMTVLTTAGPIYVLTRKTEISENATGPVIDYAPSTDEYRDKLIEISDDTIVFKNYYFPSGSKTIKLSQAEYVEAKEPTMRNGKYRLHGTGDLLFRIWFPADYDRPGRDKIFVMKVRGKWIRIGFTVENSYIVSELFKTRGLLR